MPINYSGAALDDAVELIDRGLYEARRERSALSQLESVRLAHTVGADTNATRRSRLARHLVPFIQLMT